jgi:hypothetical protein
MTPAEAKQAVLLTMNEPKQEKKKSFIIIIIIKK